MALRVGYGGPSSDLPAEHGALDAARRTVDRRTDSDDVVGVLLAAVPYTVNNRLRTGADKGNPTV